jgi:hypothetical protein
MNSQFIRNLFSSLLHTNQPPARRRQIAVSNALRMYYPSINNLLAMPRVKIPKLSEFEPYKEYVAGEDGNGKRWGTALAFEKVSHC